MSDTRGENPVRVLVVDDEPLVALYIVDVLEGAGDLHVKTAASGREALSAAELRPPDVAIIDMNLGCLPNGPTIAADLTSAYGTAIIVLSGHSDLRDDPAIRGLNPVAVLSKPCLPADLEKAVRKAIALIG